MVREVGFVQVFGFKYSQRPYTPALKLPDDVPEAVKGERLAKLFEVVEAQGIAHLTSLVGTTQRVLFEAPSKGGQPGRMQGRTDRNEIVHVDVPSEFDAVGSIADVAIVRANKHSLEGTLTDGGLAVLRRRVTTPAPSDATSGKRRLLPIVQG
jgi:tRNA-2-methylthio-N6-dimethylallyladenosine synthase